MSNDKRSGGEGRKPPRGPRKPFSGGERPGRPVRAADGDAPPRRPFRPFHRDEPAGDRPLQGHRGAGGHFRDEGREHPEGRPFRNRFEVSDDERRPRRAFEPRFEERREAGFRRREERPARDDDRRPPRGGDRRPPRDVAPPRDAAAAPAPAATEYEGERVAKVIARAGLGSRRDAEAWIEAGRVAVNGEVLASAARNVQPGDAITIDGKPLPQRERTRLWLYHKPRGLMTTEKDPEGRPTVFENLPAGLPRVMSVGRLDINTEGLLLLTNDGGLARLLELPKTGWMRRYRARAHGETDQAKLDALFQGVTVDGVEYGAVEARLDKEQGANAWLTLGLREGKNREVKNVLASIGLEVNRLIRVSYGPFQLGELAEGAVEEISTRVLKEQLGADLAEEAGCEFEAPVFAREAEAKVDKALPAAREKGRRGLRIAGEEGGAERVMRGSLVEDRRGKKVLVQRVSDAADEAAPARRPPARKPRFGAGEEGEARRERPAFRERPFRDRDEDRGERRPYRARSDAAEGGERRPRFDKPRFRDRDGESGERPARTYRPRDGEGGERSARPYRERDGEAKPRFRPRLDHEAAEGERKPFRPRPSFRDRDEGGAERPRTFRKREEGDAPRRPFREKAEGASFKPRRPRERFEAGGDAPRPSFRDRAEGAAERPRTFRKREEGDAPRRPFREKAEGTSFKPRRPRFEESGDAPRPSFRDRNEGTRPPRGPRPFRPGGGGKGPRKPRQD